MSDLDCAIQLAKARHQGQVDQAGAAYILHLARVAAQLEQPEAQIVAWLHDILEDTDTQLSELSALGFSADILTAIVCLTRRQGETRLEAAQRIRDNPLARQVKLADLTDNIDLARIAKPSSRDFARLEEYKQVWRLLNPL